MSAHCSQSSLSRLETWKIFALSLKLHRVVFGDYCGVLEEKKHTRQNERFLKNSTKAKRRGIRRANGRKRRKKL